MKYRGGQILLGHIRQTSVNQYITASRDKTVRLQTHGEFCVSYLKEPSESLLPWLVYVKICIARLCVIFENAFCAQLIKLLFS